MPFLMMPLMALSLVGNALLAWACFAWWRRLHIRALGTLTLSFFGSTVFEVGNFVVLSGLLGSKTPAGIVGYETWVNLQYGWSFVGDALLVAGAIGLLSEARGFAQHSGAASAPLSPNEPRVPPHQP